MAKLKNSKIVVIAGGISQEREISLRSGKGCFNALNRLGYNVSLLNLESGDQIMKLHRSEEIDYAFLCTHGEYGEDGKLQGILEWRSIPYTGSKVLASALCMNKLYTKQILNFNNIQTSKGCLLGDTINNELRYPLIIKPIESGSSIGVSIINSQNELEDFKLKYHSSEDNWIIEEFVTGREITVSLLQMEDELRVLPILELKSKNAFYDLEAKYKKGMTEFIILTDLEPDLQKKIESIALRSFKSLGCSGFARVDMIISEGSEFPYVLELNTLPGMTETSDLPIQAKAAGIEYDELVELMLQTVLID
ncbi:MAG: D-alanine--D-alanine ligase [Candidatus Caenarcaniphilales bacterium]|nr:D-alanine--D-alanine ligase [Candidatus Caenarcaniphilales bacterium]